MTPLHPGDRFGKFQLHQQLSARGIKQTFLAGAVGGAGRRVQLTSLAVPGSELERFFEVFREELERAGFLFHDGLQRVYEFGQIGETPFCTHEDFEGMNLRTLLDECRRQRVPLPLRCALYIAREVAGALAYAHERRLEDGRPLGAIHGAVTPHEVLISSSGWVKLGGFGVLRALGRTGQLREVLDDGAWGFLAPEIRGGSQDIDPRADGFGCAAVLYQALTFRRPDPAHDDRLVLPSALRRRATSSLDDLCVANLASEPERRWPGAEQLAAALGRLLYEEAPLFSPRDLGQFLTSVFDGSLAQAVAEHRRTAAGTPPEAKEVPGAPQPSPDPDFHEDEWPDVHLPFTTVEEIMSPPSQEAAPAPQVAPESAPAPAPKAPTHVAPVTAAAAHREPTRHSALASRGAGRETDASPVRIGGERPQSSAVFRPTIPGHRFAGGVPPPRRPAWLLWALLGLLVAAGATAAWWLSKRSDPRVQLPSPVRVARPATGPAVGGPPRIESTVVQLGGRENPG